MIFLHPRLQAAARAWEVTMAREVAPAGEAPMAGAALGEAAAEVKALATAVEMVLVDWARAAAAGPAGQQHGAP